MSGAYKGAQALIRQNYSEALYVPCSAHNLNLAGVHAVESAIEIKVFFGNVESLYAFFSESLARWKILTEGTGILLDKLSMTRWSSRIDAIKPLAKRPRKMLAPLKNAMENLDLTSEQLSQAKALKKWLSSFEFVLLITIWYKTLTAVNDVSRYLQSEAITIDDELRLIRQLLEDLKQIRGSWLQIFQEAVAVAGPLGFETELATKRKRKLKRFYDEASNTAYFHNSQTKEFEVNVFNVGLDSLIQQIDSRFEASRMVANMFSFIWLDNDDLSVQSKACELAQFYPRDVNKEDLIEKICRFKNARKTIFKQGNPLQLLNQIFEKKLERLFPYICIMLPIFSTIPVSVAEGELSFSKLKIVKNSLRSTMGQDRVTDLLIILIEEDLAKKVSYGDVIDIWAARKARKIHF
ncbi:zinc finger MYM-type protein 1-like [Hydra vulgaris]|uniref:zinc finger MYM-type protein 1-like n=1 Tax=Hydra vulgaris TaxID=6087 RepID=UPI001F5F4DCA|nr:zinc finger MYM-type protein 1-like [Hydra vulgaris]